MIDITPETIAYLIAQGWTPPPEPVDPLLAMAREICAAAYDRGQKGIGWQGSTGLALAKLREAQALVKRPAIDRRVIYKALSDEYGGILFTTGITDVVIKAMEGETND